MTDLRTIERESIRAFVQRAADEGYLSGRVLDYGCGKQPYRDIVEAAGGEYVGYDRVKFPANVSEEDLLVPVRGGLRHEQRYDSVICTQVMQYVPRPEIELARLRKLLRTPARLVLTYPTNWPEVEPEDLHRFTKAGMERLLTEAGFEIVLHEERAHTKEWHSGENLALGYGVIARA